MNHAALPMERERLCVPTWHTGIIFLVLAFVLCQLSHLFAQAVPANQSPDPKLLPQKTQQPQKTVQSNIADMSKPAVELPTPNLMSKVIRSSWGSTGAIL